MVKLSKHKLIEKSERLYSNICTRIKQVDRCRIEVMVIQ